LRRKALKPNKGVALDRAGITAFQGITFLAAGPAGELSRSAGRWWDWEQHEDRYHSGSDLG
jgi:hypothetical protein